MLPRAGPSDEAQISLLASDHLEGSVLTDKQSSLVHPFPSVTNTTSQTTYVSRPSFDKIEADDEIEPLAHKSPRQPQTAYTMVMSTISSGAGGDHVNVWQALATSRLDRRNRMV